MRPDSSICSEGLPYFGSVSCDASDCAFVDAEVTTGPLDYIIPPSHCKLGFSFSRPPSRRISTELHRPLPSADASELGTFGTLDFCSVGDDQRTSPGVSESDHSTNAEFSLEHLEPDHHHARWETSLIHIPRHPRFPHDPPTVTSRELILYLRHPRAWEIDDLVAAWRCFVGSRSGKRWVAYGTIGIVVLLQAALVDFLSSAS